MIHLLQGSFQLPALLTDPTLRVEEEGLWSEDEGADDYIEPRGDDGALSNPAVAGTPGGTQRTVWKSKGEDDPS